MSGPRVSVTSRDNGLKVLQARMKSLKEIGVQVGVFASEGAQEDGVSLAEIAVVHEFGSPDANIPERSFMRSSFEENRWKYVQFIKLSVEKVLAGTMSPKTASNRLGLMVASDMQRKIQSGLKPVLATSTLRSRAKKTPHAQVAGNQLRDRKGRYISAKAFKPLFDTGQLIKAITYKTILKGAGL